MKALVSTILINLGFTCFSTFAQDNPLFRHLPPDATSIYQINVPALALKLPWQELAQKMATAPKGKSDRMMKMMQNPLMTGINITKEFFVAQTDPTNSEGVSYTTILVYLADSAKFVAFLTKQEPGLHFVSYPGKGRGASVKDKYGAAWNKEMAVMTMVNTPDATKKGWSPEDMQAPSKGNTTQPATPKKPTPNYAALAAKKSLAALQGFEGSVYTTDAAFKAGFADDADMHMWTKQGSGLAMLMKALSHKAPMGGNKDFMKAMKMPHSNIHTLTGLRFETGKVTIKSSTMLPADTLALYQKLFGRPLNTDLVASLPQGPLLAMINLHFNPATFADMLDMSHTRGKVDSALAAKGLTMDDITRAFKGDILMAVVNPAGNGADTTAGTGKPKSPYVYIATTIGDMSSFTKLAGKMKLWKDSAVLADSNQTSPSLMDKAKMSYTLKNDVLVISTSKQNADAWFSNSEKRSTDFIPALVIDNPFSVFFDVRTVSDFLRAMSKDDNSEKNKKILQALGQLDTFIIAGGAVQDGKVQSTIELKLTNGSENSLKGLLKMF